jgi:hypothetical protein
MLNLYVRPMKPRLLLPLVLLLIAAQDAPSIAITSPKEGDILRGPVTITGTTDIPNFLSSRLDFAYASVSQSSANWFTLQTSSQPTRPEGSALFTWDTTSITDGDYILRLQVSLADGSSQEVMVPIRIQNDTPLPTPTVVPTATPEDAFSIQIPTPFLLAASPTPTDVPRPTPTALPTNPVSLGQAQIYTSLGRGALVIIGLFVLSGILLWLRRS